MYKKIVSHSSFYNFRFLVCALFTICIYGSMAPMSVSATIVIFFAIVQFALSREKQLSKSLLELWRTPLFKASIFLALTCSFSLFWAHFSKLRFYGYVPHIDFIGDHLKLWHLFFPFVLLSLFKKLTPIQLKTILKLWLLVGLCSALVGIIQHFIPFYKPQEIPQVAGRYHSTGFAGFHLSYVVILGFPLMLWICEGLRGSIFLGWMRRFVPVAALLCVLASLLSFSKTNFVVLPIGIAALLFIRLPRKYRFWVAFGFFVFLFTCFSIDSIRERFNWDQLVYGSLRDRLNLWDANLEMVRQFPWSGVGWHHNSPLSEAYYNHIRISTSLSDVRFLSHAHNNFIDQWSGTGTLGLVAYFVFNTQILLLCWFLSKRGARFYKNLGIGFFMGWFLLHLNGMTQTNFWDAKVMHQLSWVLAMLLVQFKISKQD